MNAVYQRCERDVLATCNCGVMVRSGDDVLVIDRCARRRQRMPPPLQGFSDAYAPIMSVMLYLNGRLTPGTRVHQLANGHKYIVSFSLSKGLRGVNAGMVRVCGWQVKLCDPLVTVTRPPYLSTLEIRSLYIKRYIHSEP